MCAYHIYCPTVFYSAYNCSVLGKYKQYSNHKTFLIQLQVAAIL